MVLPNFFVVGAPKAGTTALYEYLGQHPQVFMSPLKEPCYFATEIRPEKFAADLQPQVRREQETLRAYLAAPVLAQRFGGLVTEWQDYLKLFAAARSEKAIGEASVCYLWSEGAAARIRSKIPEARILMILRDPAERAFSQYLHAVTNGVVRGSFHDQVRSALSRQSDAFGPLYPFLEFGLYHEQVKRYLAEFPRNRVKICFYEDYRQDPAATMAGIFAFLDVDPDFPVDTSARPLEPRIPKFVSGSYFLKRHGVWRWARERAPDFLLDAVRRWVFRRRESLAMNPRDRAPLVDYYREDVGKLAQFVNRDLTAWLA